MPAPFTVTSPTNDTAVFTVDGTGDTIQTGTATETGVVLTPSTAPPTAPGSISLYNNAGTLTTPAGLSVGGTLTPGNVATGSLAVSGGKAGGLVTVTNTVTTTTPDILLTENAAASLAVGTKVSGDTNPRFTAGADGAMKWGPGSGVTDTNLYRVATGVLQTDQSLTIGGLLNVFGNEVVDGSGFVAMNLEIGSTTTLGDNGVGEIQLADAGTVPTTNPTAGTLLYSQSATSAPLKVRDITGNVRSVTDAVTVLVSTSAAITTVAQTAVSGLAVAIEANATYLMESVFYINSTVNTADTATYTWTGPAGAAMQWGDTNTTGDYNATLTTVASGDMTLTITKRILVLKGTLTTSSTAGTLTPTFGVSAITTSPSYTVLSGSYVRLTRVI